MASRPTGRKADPDAAGRADSRIAKAWAQNDSREKSRRMSEYPRETFVSYAPDGSDSAIISSTTSVDGAVVAVQIKEPGRKDPFKVFLFNLAECSRTRLGNTLNMNVATPTGAINPATGKKLTDAVLKFTGGDGLYCHRLRMAELAAFYSTVSMAMTGKVSWAEHVYGAFLGADSQSSIESMQRALAIAPAPDKLARVRGWPRLAGMLRGEGGGGAATGADKLANLLVRSHDLIAIATDPNASYVQPEGLSPQLAAEFQRAFPEMREHARAARAAAAAARAVLRRAPGPSVRRSGRWVPEILSIAGAEPPASADPRPGDPPCPLAWASVRRRADDAIVVCRPGGGAADAAAEAAALAALPGWWSLPAVRRGQVYVVDSALLLRPGPRLAQGAALLAHICGAAAAAAAAEEGGGFAGVAAAAAAAAAGLPPPVPPSLPPGSARRLILHGGQRCRARLLPFYFEPL